MFVNAFDNRFKVPMYCDERLQNKTPFFCLCTNCKKSDITGNIICQKHDAFMRMTQELRVTAPVFSCQDFEESDDLYNYLDSFYDERSSLFIDSRNGNTILIDAEHSRKLQSEWKAQLALWEREECVIK